MVQHYQFSAIASPGDLTHIYGLGLKNLGYDATTGKYWFGMINPGVSNQLLLYSVSSLTGLQEEETFKTASVAGTITNVICRNFGNDIYCFGTLFVAATHTTYLEIIYSTDGGVNFTTLERTYSFDVIETDCRAVDICRMVAETYFIFTHIGGGAGRMISHALGANTNTVMMTGVGATSSAGGNVVSDVYYHLTHNGAAVHTYSWDGTTNTELEELALTTPDWGTNEQCYVRFEMTEIAIFADRLYTKSTTDSLWQEIADNTYTWGIIWDHDANDDYTANYLIFGGYIWQIDTKGIPMKIQAFAANAGHGYEDWFTNGANIYQATLTTLSDWKNAKIAMALYTVPQLTYQSQTEPFDEQLLEIYEDDYAVDPSILTEFDAALTGWTDGDNPNCESTYQATKTLDFAISHVMQLYDNSGTGVADQHQHYTGKTVFSIWWGTSDVTKLSYIVFYEGASTEVADRRGYLQIDNSLMSHFNETALVTVLNSVVNNTWYHIVVQFDASTEKMKLWIDGIYIDEKTITDAFASIDTVRILTGAADSAYYAYFACPYAGNSLAEALSSYWAYQSPRLLFRGYVSNVTTDGTAFVVTALDPIVIDLERPVTVTYAAKTAHYILKDVLDTYCQHLWYASGISTTPATTYSVVFQETSILEIIRFCDSVESYQTSIRPSGEVYWDTYVEVGHALDVGSLIQALPLVSKDTRKFGRFVLFGGLDITTGAPFKSVILQNVNFDTHTDELPSIRDQTALDAANLKIATAKNISLKKLTFHSGRSPVIYPGEEAIITLPQHSIAGATWYCITSKYNIDQKRYEHVLTDAYWQPPTYVTYRNNLPSSMWANLRSLLTEEQLRYLMAHAKDFEDRITALE